MLLEIKRIFPAPIITVANKSDRGEGVGIAKTAIAVSATEGTGVDALKEAINIELCKISSKASDLESDQS